MQRYRGRRARSAGYQGVLMVENRESLPNGKPESLMERLDPAIGEASSGIGVLLAELVRRTLRGGVSRIDQEIDSLVGEKVDQTVALRMPDFEMAAVRKATDEAHSVAGRLVGDMRGEIRQEIQGETKATEERLATEIHQVREHATVSIERVNSEFAETTKRFSEEISAAGTEIKTTSERLKSEIDETRSHTATGISQIKAETTQKVQTVSEEIKTTREKLLSGLSEAEKRAIEKSRELVDSEIKELKTKSQKTYQSLCEQLERVSSLNKELEERLTAESAGRRDDLVRLEDALSSKLTLLVEENRRLHDRLAELERPKGIRALWGKVFKGKAARPNQSGEGNVDIADNGTGDAPNESST